MTKEEEKAIENLTKLLKQRDEKHVKITTYNLFENIETVLSMLKENSAELAEKSAEIEKYKSLYNKALEDLAKTNRKNIENIKVIDLMVKAMNKIQDPQICKYCDNNINLNHGYCTDAKKCKEGVKNILKGK